MHSQAFHFTCKVTAFRIYCPHVTSLMSHSTYADDEIPAYRGKHPAPTSVSSKETSRKKQDENSAAQTDVIDNPPKDPTEEQMKDPGT